MAEHYTLVIIVIILYTTTAVTGISWTILTSRIIFGGDLELICRTPEICKGCSKRWHRGSDSQLLTYDGAPTNPLKYTSHIFEDGFNLVIKDFTIDDAREEYICTYGFQSVKKKLLEDDNFEYYRSKNVSVNSTLDKTSTLDVQLEFEKVFPIPVCFIVLNNQSLTDRLNINIRKETIFYHVTFCMNATLNNITCKSALHMYMYCHVGTLDINVINQDIEHGQCNGTFNGSTRGVTWKAWTITVAIVAFVIVVMAIATLVICHKGRGKKRKKKNTFRNGKEGNTSKATELIELNKENNELPKLTNPLDD